MAGNFVLTYIKFMYFLYRLPKLFNFSYIQALLFLLEGNLLESRDYLTLMYSYVAYNRDQHFNVFMNIDFLYDQFYQV